jgi:HAD superfamily hydrolase (TIGR01509 family)
MTIGLIIFDCDGVLVDSEPLACAVVARELSDAGVPITGEEIAQRYAGVAAATMYADIEHRWQRSLPDDLPARVRSRTLDAFADGLQAMPGVRTLLPRLDPVALCVASSSDLTRVTRALSMTDLLRFFDDHIYSASQVRHGKPAPDLFLFAADRMGVSPQQSLVVEDSVAGVTAARAAGMMSIGFHGGSHCGADHRARLEAAGAETTIPSFEEWPRAIADLQHRHKVTLFTRSTTCRRTVIDRRRRNVNSRSSYGDLGK